MTLTPDSIRNGWLSEWLPKRAPSAFNFGSASLRKPRSPLRKNIGVIPTRLNISARGTCCQLESSQREVNASLRPSGSGAMAICAASASAALANSAVTISARVAERPAANVSAARKAANAAGISLFISSFLSTSCITTVGKARHQNPPQERQSPLHDGERVGLHANDAGAV